MKSKFNMEKTNIDGLIILTPIIYEDNRGYFFEAYNENDFILNGLNYKFVQDNEVVTKKNVLRGMHVNVNNPQGKLIRVLDGEIYDVVIDLRKDSPTYMNVFSAILSENNKKQLYIPEGLGHGYYAIKDSRILFKVTTHYKQGDEIGFSWKSKKLIDLWPNIEPILNERDAENMDLEEVLKWM